MVERLLIIVFVAAVVVLSWKVGAAVRRRRAVHIALPKRLMLSGKPLLLSFSTPGCADCRYRQAPAVALVEQELEHALTARHVDASREPDLAAHFGILTAPSTVILDRHGRVAARNDGFASSNTLLTQLRPLIAAT